MHTRIIEMLYADSGNKKLQFTMDFTHKMW